MNLDHRAASTDLASQRQNEPYKRLSGPWLIFVRSLWIATVVPAYVVFIVNIPAYYASLHLQRAPDMQTFSVQLTSSDIQALQSMGLSLDFYAAGMVVVTLLFQFSYALVGLLIFFRRPDYRIALLTSFSLTMLPFGFAYITLQGLPGNWWWLIPTLNSLGNASIMLTGLLIPDGRFAPRWTSWVALIMLSYWAAVALFPSWELGRSVPSLLLFCGFIAGILLTQVYRYRFVSTPRQRQQTKWLVFGTAVAAGGNIGARLLYYFVFLPLLNGSALAGSLEIALVMCALLALPAAFGIALFSSRLWDIDVLINRVLIYSTLTTTLALLYAGLVFILQMLLRGSISQNNDIALVVSTLIIATLFQPLHRYIKQIIDRRFYRRKYDATRILTAFQGTLRHEVDLEQLSNQIVEVVGETMQPEHVSLWLLPLGWEAKRATRLLPRLE